MKILTRRNASAERKEWGRTSLNAYVEPLEVIAALVPGIHTSRQ